MTTTQADDDADAHVEAPSTTSSGGGWWSTAVVVGSMDSDATTTDDGIEHAATDSPGDSLRQSRGGRRAQG